MSLVAKNTESKRLAMQQDTTITHRVFVSALEPSANLHLKALAYELNTLAEQRGVVLEIVGIFDHSAFVDCAHLRAHSSYELSAFAVMAFVDVIKKYFFYKRVNDEMIALAKTCKKALLLDSSSFHIPLAKGLRGSGVEVVYYILPQVWAWKSWRAKEIERICDRLCAILPFELSMYPNALKDGRARYVGHPLLDELPLDSVDSMDSSESAESRESTESAREGKAGRGQTIVFMPGSRRGEIGRIFPIFVRLARELSESKVLVAPAHFANLPKDELHRIYGDGLEEFALSFDSTQALRACKFAFICSGTATLQAALLGAPFVLAYTMRKIEYHIARAFVGLNVVGLANILYQGACGESAGRGEQRLHTELIQDELSVENLLDSYKHFDYQTYARNAKKLRAYLGYGSSRNVATVLLENLTQTPR